MIEKPLVEKVFDVYINEALTEEHLHFEDVKKAVDGCEEEDLRVKKFIQKVGFKKDRDWNNHGEIISLIINELEISRRNKDGIIGEFK